MFELRAMYGGHKQIAISSVISTGICTLCFPGTVSQGTPAISITIVSVVATVPISIIIASIPVSVIPVIISIAIAISLGLLAQLPRRNSLTIPCSTYPGQSTVQSSTAPLLFLRIIDSTIACIILRPLYITTFSQFADDPLGFDVKMFCYAAAQSSLFGRNAQMSPTIHA